MADTARDKRLAEFAKAAVEAEAETGFPAPVMVAMFAQESGWGRSVSGVNNVFGITFRPWHKDGYTMCPTWEVMTKADMLRLDSDERSTIESQEPIPGSDKVKIRLKRKFANFPTLKDCIAEKVRILTTSPRYADAVKSAITANDEGGLINAIAGGGWATDPTYATAIKKIKSQKNVQEAVQQARLVLA